MTADAFTHWLQGFMAAAGPTLTEDQVRTVTEKLATVQTYVYPYIIQTMQPAPTYPVYTGTRLTFSDGT